VPGESDLDDYPLEEKPKRGRGRLPGFRMSDAHRVKIQNSNILNALMEHVRGKREMSSTQATVGIALLKKVLPDLQSVQISGDPEHPLEHKHHNATDAERAAAVMALIAKAK
jgi:hypothetical protein